MARRSLLLGVALFVIGSILYFLGVVSDALAGIIAVLALIVIGFGWNRRRGTPP